MATIIDLQTVATAALADAKTAVAAVKSELAAAEAVVATKGVQLTQSQMAHDAIAVAHAAATGAMSVAPKVATVWTDIKATVSTVAPWAGGVGAVGLGLYAHYGLKLF
jgi:hypothetical protein